MQYSFEYLRYLWVFACITNSLACTVFLATKATEDAWRTVAAMGLVLNLLPEEPNSFHHFEIIPS